MSYRGKEHCEDVDGGLGDVTARDGDHDGGQEGEVTERQQQRRRQLAAERLGRRVVCASPAAPPCGQTAHNIKTGATQRTHTRSSCRECSIPALQTQAAYR